MKLTTALVTGATGFTGSHLLERLADESVRRIASARSEPQRTAADDFVPCDVTRPDQVDRLVAATRPDLIFHLAGGSAGSPEEMDRLNAGGTRHLLEAVRRHRPEAHVLIVGSAAEYGHVPAERMPITEDEPVAPLSPYGRAKASATAAALAAARSGLRVVIARPFNLVGAGVPSSLVVGAVLERARRALLDTADPEIPVGNLDSERDFVAVEDAADAFARMLMDGKRWGEAFNVCSGHPQRVGDVLETLLRYAPRPVRLRVDPELVSGSEVRVSYGSWAKAHAAFGWAPRTPLEDALARACAAALDPAAG